MERIAKTVYAACVDILPILITGPIYMVEVPKGNPHGPSRRLMRNELGKESAFERSGSWAIDSGNLELHVGSFDMNQCREAKGIGGDARGIYELAIP